MKLDANSIPKENIWYFHPMWMHEHPPQLCLILIFFSFFLIMQKEALLLKTPCQVQYLTEKVYRGRCSALLQLKRHSCSVTTQPRSAAEVVSLDRASTKQEISKSEDLSVPIYLVYSGFNCNTIILGTITAVTVFFDVEISKQQPNISKLTLLLQVGKLRQRLAYEVTATGALPWFQHKIGYCLLESLQVSKATQLF